MFCRLPLLISSVEVHVDSALTVAKISGCVCMMVAILWVAARRDLTIVANMPRKGCVNSDSWNNDCSESNDCPPEAEFASRRPQMFQNPYGIFPFEKLSSGVCGLPNLGNTCYMNAALQALSNCPQITEYFLQCSELIDSSRSLMAVHYQNLLGRIWLPPRSTVVSPLPILREVKCSYPMFSGYSQHDAQEFLRVFLNHLHDELKTKSVTPPIINDAPCQNDEDVRSSDITLTGCDRSLDQLPVIRNKSKTKRNRSKTMMAAEGDDDCLVCSSSPSAAESVDDLSKPTPVDSDGQSIITDVFQGKLVSAVQCLSCKQVTCREEVFLDLSVSLRRPDTNHSVSGHAPNVPASNPLFRLLTQAEPLLSTSPSSAFYGGCPDPSPHRTNALLPVTLPKPALPVTRTALPNNCNRRSRHFNVGRPMQQLLKLRDSIPLVKRLILQLFGFIALSFTWMFSRLADVQEWFSRPSLSLEDCLSDFFSQAELNGENKYHCDRCKKLCNGLNQIALVSLPEVMCIHLKRFRAHSLDASKITSAVTFPLEGLDLKPYLHNDCQDQITTYDLISVICHRGGFGGGHYVTCALSCYRHTWFEFDDDHVTELDPQHVAQLTNEAYILFYRKRDADLVPLRNDADRLLQNHLQCKSTRMVYISRPWFVRFGTWAEPGPITNAKLLCLHGNLQPEHWYDRKSTLLRIPEELWSKLVHEFGGGPLLRDCSPCPTCHKAIVIRQHREMLLFDRAFEQCEPIAESRGLYAISSNWFDSWKRFVEGKSLRVPCPIDNSDIAHYRTSTMYLFNNHLFGASQTTGAGSRQPRLKVGACYTELFDSCWDLLLKIYGGGPAICIRQAVTVAISPPSDVHKVNDTSISFPTIVTSPSVTTPRILSPLYTECLSDGNAKGQVAKDRVSSPLLLETSNDSLSSSSPHVPSCSACKIVSINGDGESGVYSAERTSFTNYSSTDFPDGDHPLHPHDTNQLDTSYVSLSAENLVSLYGKGDWDESGCSSLAFDDLTDGTAHLNGFHSRSVGHVNTMKSDTRLLFPEGSNTAFYFRSTEGSDGNLSASKLKGHTVVIKRPRLMLQP
ncbi:Ubiquitin carboxyl-terminal hydrolase 20/33 [Paragonimus heterotremus]|uniref:ubiquitinyl hydrolase 1 n=1 Tax=Paragonimus heterotremus TaxID=100268 RepID=A0A8J4T2B6_9TREM|nr:Ubiquitin carboxyl-terminal hydrolase 20/33 [Paragonimus heterotremus]